MFGARAPAGDSSKFYELQKIGVSFSASDGRTARQQAGYQIAALGVTVGIALLGGTMTGKKSKIQKFI